ncbi:MAG: leucyl/phenylalanyl-tRNA--protein transferase [Saprospiraceae bacterium]
MTILDDHDITFPHPHTADDNGIVALGGDLKVDRLLLAYQYGFFPWFNPEDPILWWHPDPRFVIFTEDIRVTKSMRPYFNKEKFKLTFDKQFENVLRACQNIDRKDQNGTWITEQIISSYTKLHEMGLAHSVEVWDQDGYLVGGLYGVSLGKIFYGESMFSRVSNASKFALISLSVILRQHGFYLIDCQMPNPHLKSMGGRFISRNAFLAYLRGNIFSETIVGDWDEIMNIYPVKDILKQ